MTEYGFWVYILFDTPAHATYIGVTNNLRLRVYEHKMGMIDGYTKKHHIDKLGYYERYQYIDNAIAREKMLKKWKRAWKYRLIETMNPNWDDLCSDIDEYISSIKSGQG